MIRLAIGVPFTVFAASAPDFGNPGSLSLAAGCGGFAWALDAKARGRTVDEVKDAAFRGTFYGFGIGLLLYVGALVGG